MPLASYRSKKFRWTFFAIKILYFCAVSSNIGLQIFCQQHIHTLNTTLSFFVMDQMWIDAKFEIQSAFNCSFFTNSTNAERCKRNITATCSIIVAAIVFVIFFYILKCIFSRQCLGRYIRQYLYRLCSCCRCCCCYAISVQDVTKVEQEVRRNWLRGIKTYIESQDPLSVHDLEMAKLLQFFKERPGLRRYVGGRIVKYYAQPSAKRIKRNNKKRSRVAPV